MENKIPIAHEPLEDQASQRGGVKMIPSVTKWLQNPLPGLLINILEEESPPGNISDRSDMFTAANASSQCFDADIQADCIASDLLYATAACQLYAPKQASWVDGL